MKTFQCDQCQSPVYFENTRCLSCGSILGIIPGTYEVHSVTAVGSGSLKASDGKLYRLCKNSIDHAGCNQLVLEGSPSPYCQSCQFTEITPDLAFDSNRDLWFKMEKAKRRLLFSLIQLGIAPTPKLVDPVKGLAFRFLVDNSGGVLTGHEDGVITITLAEADDTTREARREQMGEDYRTLLGHFRHEIGHYFWDRLIMDANRHEEFRRHFGDEREDYQQALQKHYAKAPDDSWEDQFISLYASAHPWEDWAECFAHYLHMRDVVETSHAVGLLNSGNPPAVTDFQSLSKEWLATSFRINLLGRSMGNGDLYPFVLKKPVLTKMNFIHDVVMENTR